MLGKLKEESAKLLFARVESIRAKKGMSMESAANSIGVSRNTIRNLAKGLATEKSVGPVVAWINRNERSPTPP